MYLERILDHPAVSRSAVFRKGKAFTREPLLRMQRVAVHPSDFAGAPPIIVNSLPKSGTHLLLQVTRALPGTRYFGRFIATSPSLTQRQRTPKALSRRIIRTLPRETLGAHLYHFPEIARALERINALHLFIYRDPRDVVTSEAWYLAEMNRWHRMHKHFHALNDEKARLSLALDGLDARYPEANARLLPYAGWIHAPNVVAIRYEDLSGPRQGDEIARIIAAWRACGAETKEVDNLVQQLREAVDPGNSHTFREGGSGKWRRGMTEPEAEDFTRRLEPSLIAYGYTA